MVGFGLVVMQFMFRNIDKFCTKVKDHVLPGWSTHHPPPTLFIIMVQTRSAVGFAFALSIAAGMSTCIGGAIVFFKRLVQLASPRTLSVSLSLSAGVMIFISLVEIFGKSASEAVELKDMLVYSPTINSPKAEDDDDNSRI